MKSRIVHFFTFTFVATLLLLVSQFVNPVRAHAQEAVSCEFIEYDYLALNEDVLTAVEQGEYKTGYEHYVKKGQFEGRRVNFNCTDGYPAYPTGNCQFNEHDYLFLNPDVVEAIRRGEFLSGYDHYIRVGQFENRRISLSCGRIHDGRWCEYNESDYLFLNPDVATAVRRGEFSSGYEHYIRYGQYEGRQISVLCENHRPYPGRYGYPSDYPAHYPRGYPPRYPPCPPPRHQGPPEHYPPHPGGQHPGPNPGPSHPPGGGHPGGGHHPLTFDENLN